MASLDLTMLGIGLAVVWIGIAAYVVRLGAIASRLQREVRNLRGVVARQRRHGLQDADEETE